jgi:hypothetical protein
MAEHSLMGRRNVLLRITYVDKSLLYAYNLPFKAPPRNIALLFLVSCSFPLFS